MFYFVAYLKAQLWLITTFTAILTLTWRKVEKCIFFSSLLDSSFDEIWRFKSKITPSKMQKNYSCPIANTDYCESTLFFFIGINFHPQSVFVLFCLFYFVWLLHQTARFKIQFLSDCQSTKQRSLTPRSVQKCLIRVKTRREAGFTHFCHQHVLASASLATFSLLQTPSESLRKPHLTDRQNS